MIRSMKKILIIQGHPNESSYCAALASAYFQGAQSAGASVQVLNLFELAFDPVLHHSKALQQPLEEDLLKAQDWIRQADHLVLFYPTWWGSCPALLKGFFDRILTQGFAFQYHTKDPLWDKLLTGKTAHIITTMSTPSWFYQSVFGDWGIKTVKHQILGFCGIKTNRITRIGQIRKLNDETLKHWLNKLQQMGQKLY